MIDCPIVADPNPKPNKPRFGCSVVTIGSSDIENVTVQYIEKEANVEVENESMAIKALGNLLLNNLFLWAIFGLFNFTKYFHPRVNEIVFLYN